MTGAITVDTIDYGPVQVDEPSWCIVDHAGQPVAYRADLTHNGRPVAAVVETVRGTVRLLEARISWAPFAEVQPEPHPVADVDDLPPMGPGDLRELALELVVHAARLYEMAGVLEAIREAGS